MLARVIAGSACSASGRIFSDGLPCARKQDQKVALLHGGFERQEGAVVESFTRCVGNELARVFAFC
jgi:hypothetical protein